MNRWVYDACGYDPRAHLQVSLEQAIAGDARAVDVLARVPHEELERIASELLVSAVAAARVLRDLASAAVDGAIAQRWASFVRRGYVSGPSASGPVRPIVIDYEADHEDAIVAVVDRLDQIGDQVDGEVPDRQEIEAMLRSLAEPELASPGGDLVAELRRVVRLEVHPGPAHEVYPEPTDDD